jgi:5-methyltetrahydrofolate--homocysteine methyltransferase
MTATAPFVTRARDRGLRLDGAMATFVHTLHGGRRGVEQCDRFSLSKPHLVTAAHDAYLAAGADIVRTNSFRATSREHASDARDICLASARLARAAVDRWSRRTPDRPRFVAGALGPPDADTSRDGTRAAYRGAARALVDGGIDALLFETCYAPAHVNAAMTACADLAADTGHAIPAIISMTLNASGRFVVSDAPLGEAIDSIDSALIAGLGLNCGVGPADLEQHLQTLRGHSAIITCHPSAGLPDASGHYPAGPDEFARNVGAYAASGLAHVVGGCCGTTPAHIAALAHAGRE